MCPKRRRRKFNGADNSRGVSDMLHGLFASSVPEFSRWGGGGLIRPDIGIRRELVPGLIPPTTHHPNH